MSDIKLSEEAQKEAIRLLEGFKKKMLGVCEDTLSDLYCYIMPYIESDSWSNFRGQIISAFQEYDKKNITTEYDIKQLRQAILAHHREEIIKDLNQDLLKEIEELKKTLQKIREGYRM
jgi:hypothetical protein